MVHEAAVCTTGLRQQRSLPQKGFELAHGLPFVATDQAIHQLLGTHTVADAQALPVALGQIRRASGHYDGKILLENYYLPGKLESAISRFVGYYNHERYHESLDNLTPADLYYGRGEMVLSMRQKIKRRTLEQRRQLHYQRKAA